MNLFLDSGAFSAWTKKTEINLDEYMQFIKDHKKALTVYANLDVIGDPEGTWVNQKIMEDNGLKPIPIFHMGSSDKYLKKCMDYEYFALGAMAKQSSSNRVDFLDDVFKKIGDKDGIPTRKLHGLGMTSFDLMKRYPFYSVDSTSWLIHAAMSIVLIPRSTKGKYDFTKKPMDLGTTRKKKAKLGQGSNVLTVDKDSKEYISKYLTGIGLKFGTGREDVPEEDKGVIDCYKQRAKANIHFYKEFARTIPEYPWAFRKNKKARLF